MKVLNKYKELTIERKILQKQIKKKKLRYSRLNREIEARLEAINILVELSKTIYQEVITKIESVVTLSIRYVYDRPFEFKIKLEEKRNNIEAKFVLTEGEDEYEIKGDQGGGMINIISLAIRIVMWKIKEPKTRPFFSFDEPFYWLGNYIEKAGRMLKYLADELELQILLLTHEPDLKDICDRMYRIDHDGVKSHATLIKKRKLKRRKN